MKREGLDFVGYHGRIDEGNVWNVSLVRSWAFSGAMPCIIHTPASFGFRDENVAKSFPRTVFMMIPRPLAT